ncbi:MAG: hypothetical protein DRJ40_00970 [Thermoprotei archaeon]|nr:MAG: hypothetical protein DRJ40_00970 [Thermoprotei archaeon]
MPHARTHAVKLPISRISVRSLLKVLEVINDLGGSCHFNALRGRLRVSDRVLRENLKILSYLGLVRREGRGNNLKVILLEDGQKVLTSLKSGDCEWKFTIIQRFLTFRCFRELLRLLKKITSSGCRVVDLDVLRNELLSKEVADETTLNNMISLLKSLKLVQCSKDLGDKVIVLNPLLSTWLLKAEIPSEIFPSPEVMYEIILSIKELSVKRGKAKVDLVYRPHLRIPLTLEQINRELVKRGYSPLTSIEVMKLLEELRRRGFILKWGGAAIPDTRRGFRRYSVTYSLYVVI